MAGQSSNGKIMDYFDRSEVEWSATPSGHYFDIYDITVKFSVRNTGHLGGQSSNDWRPLNFQVTTATGTDKEQWMTRNWDNSHIQNDGNSITEMMTNQVRPSELRKVSVAQVVTGAMRAFWDKQNDR